jgi:hypothetical protein
MRHPAKSQPYQAENSAEDEVLTPRYSIPAKVADG